MSRVRDAEFYRLKSGFRDLFERCGGLARSGRLVGRTAAMLGKVNDRDEGAFLAIDATLLLERDCGEPVVTRVMAEILGFQLEGGGSAAAPRNPYGAVAEISREYAELVEQFALRTVDGVFSKADGAALDRELAGLIAKAEAFRRFIAAAQAAPP